MPPIPEGAGGRWRLYCVASMACPIGNVLLRVRALLWSECNYLCGVGTRTPSERFFGFLDVTTLPLTRVVVCGRWDGGLELGV